LGPLGCFHRVFQSLRQDREADGFFSKAVAGAVELLNQFQAGAGIAGRQGSQDTFKLVNRILSSSDGVAQLF